MIQKIKATFAKIRFKRENPLPSVTLPFDAHIQKLKRRYAITFFIALIIGGWYSYNYHQNYQSQNEIIKVIVATKDITSPHLIDYPDLEYKSIPRKHLPSQFFLETKELINQTLIQDLVKGEILLPHNLKPKTDPRSISARFEEDYAFTLNEEWLIARLPNLKKNDHIDLLVSNPSSNADQNLIIAGNLKILSVQTTKGGKKTLVLNTTKSQSESIIAARGLRLPMQVLVRSSISSDSGIQDPRVN